MRLVPAVIAGCLAIGCASSSGSSGPPPSKTITYEVSGAQVDCGNADFMNQQTASLLRCTWNSAVYAFPTQACRVELTFLEVNPAVLVSTTAGNCAPVTH